MRESPRDIATRLQPARGPYSKDHPFYDVYELYFAAFRDQPITMVEAGVYEGESTRVFSEYFNNAKILATDIEKRTDLSDLHNVSFHEFSLTDGHAWTKLLNEYAPDGVDIILDDASHVGYFSQITFYHLFSRLKPGGLYVVEDWGSGYYPNHPDGGPFSPRGPTLGEGDFPEQIDSHNFRMVGFIKWLIDLAGSQDILVGGGEPLPFGEQPFDSFHIHHGTAVIRKAF